LALVGGEWSASYPGHFTLRERTPGNPWIEGWVDPRASLDDVEKRKFLTLLELELQFLGYSVTILTMLLRHLLYNETMGEFLMS
jgi:hypothetical protein